MEVKCSISIQEIMSAEGGADGEYRSKRRVRHDLNGHNQEKGGIGSAVVNNVSRTTFRW